MLRPELYDRLVQRLGEVRVANEGEAMNAWVTYDPVTRRPRLVENWPGEYYRVCCCFCKDTRFRLYINHRWGRYEPSVRSKNLWLAHCFNENCLARPGRARQLYDYVFDDFGDVQLGKDIILPGKRAPRAPAVVEPPGTMVPLSQLPAEHPACRYVLERGYDPSDLSARYRVHYCTQATAQCPQVTGRLVIPIYMRGKLVGWQARYLGKPPARHIAKYHSMPHMNKGEILYNFDAARQCSYVVVVEGVFDVWRYGPEAVALLGNKPTHYQSHLLRSVWMDKPVLCMLDGEARDEPGPLRHVQGQGGAAHPRRPAGRQGPRRLQHRRAAGPGHPGCRDGGSEPGAVE